MKKANESEKASDGTSYNSEDLRRSLDTIDVFIRGISEKYLIPADKVIDLLRRKDDSHSVPSSIFRDGRLGILEAVIKYLKENQGYSYHKIAELLKRDDRVVWTSYNNAIKKRKEPLQALEPNVWIPISIFSEDIAPLKAVSKFLIEKLKMDYSSSAKLLSRNPKSIWACYKRPK